MRDSRLKEELEELKSAANRLFSSTDGKLLAQQMLKASRMFKSDNSVLPESDLRRIAAFQDFVNLFIVGLVDKDVLLGVFEYEREK